MPAILVRSEDKLPFFSQIQIGCFFIFGCDVYIKTPDCYLVSNGQKVNSVEIGSGKVYNFTTEHRVQPIADGTGLVIKNNF